MSYTSVQNIPTRTDSDSTWINWYKDLKSTLGYKKANDVFARAWTSQNATDSNANTTTLREFMKKNGMVIDGGIMGEALDFASTVTNFVGGTFTTGKWLATGLAIVVVVSVGGLIWQIAFKSSVRKEALDIGTTVGTRGLNKL